jgi:flagellin
MDPARRRAMLVVVATPDNQRDQRKDFSMSLRIHDQSSPMRTLSAGDLASRAMSRSLERLSSGLRINRASDDAASLSISESLRAQVRGRHAALNNSQDFVSLIQTADGALGQITENLQRIRELAVQAANDTNDAKARGMIQTEIDALVKEIDAVGSDTAFNSQKLMDGTFTGHVAQVGANGNETMSVDIADMKANALGLSGVTTGTLLSDLGITSGTMVINWNFGGIPGAPQTVAVNAGDTLGTFLTSIGSGGFAWNATLSGGVVTITANSPAPLGFTISGASTSNAGAVTKLSSGTLVVGNATVKSTLTGSAPMGGGGLSVSSNADANKAIATVDAALDKVNSERGKLGALQNRLEANIRNLSVGLENMSAAESRMRDLDVADEMTDYARSSILSQSATSLVAQANFSAQTLMQLLA